MSRIRWQFTEEELSLARTKYKKSQLYFALQLKHYEHSMEFIEDITSLSTKTIYAVAKKLELPSQLKPLSNKTQAIYRQEIREYFQSKAVSAGDELLIKNWLTDTVFPHESLGMEQLKERASDFLIKHKVEPLSEGALERVIKSAKHQHEEAWFESIHMGLDPESKNHLDKLLIVEKNVSRLSEIKRWPGGVSLETILGEAEKLKFLNLIVLPKCLNDIPNKALQRHYRNICTKYPSAIKNMPISHRYALLAVFSLIKRRQVTDNLVDLLIRLTKKIVTSGVNTN